jgi:clan AA aspartic protease (TIGR02281 family)
MFDKRWILLAACFPVLAAPIARAAESGAEASLKEKGLRRLGYYFSLPEESELSKSLRELESVKKQAVDAHLQALAAKNMVDEKRRLMLVYLQRRRELRAQLPFARTVDQHNQVVTALNELGDRLVIMEESEQQEKALEQARAAASAALEQYVERILETRKFYDEVAKRYEKLAADPAVTKAIEEYNRTSSRAYRLGPSSLFTGNGKKLDRLEQGVLSESIPLRKGDGGLWYVTAMFNGKFPVEIAIDTGASVIALPWETAAAVGLSPGDDAEVMRVQVADGRTLEASRVTAETVRVGKFTASQVECAVMPPGLPESTPLLGLTFFRNFSFKIDSGRGQLVMSQIEAPRATGRTPVSSRRSRTAGSRRRVLPPRSSAATPKAEPAVPEPVAGEPADRTQQIVEALTPQGPQGQAGGVAVQVQPGVSLTFQPAAPNQAVLLLPRFGKPDSILPFQLVLPGPDGTPQPVPCQIWSWGPARVLVDANGNTRYFAVTEK